MYLLVAQRHNRMSGTHSRSAGDQHYYARTGTWSLGARSGWQRSLCETVGDIDVTDSSVSGCDETEGWPPPASESGGWRGRTLSGSACNNHRG